MGADARKIDYYEVTLLVPAGPRERQPEEWNWTGNMGTTQGLPIIVVGQRYVQPNEAIALLAEAGEESAVVRYTDSLPAEDRVAVEMEELDV